MCLAPQTAAAPLQQKAALRPYWRHQIAVTARIGSGSSSSGGAPHWRRWLQTPTGWMQIKVGATPAVYLQPSPVKRVLSAGFRCQRSVYRLACSAGVKGGVG